MANDSCPLPVKGETTVKMTLRQGVVSSPPRENPRVRTGAAAPAPRAYCGKIAGNTILVVKMQRSLCPHSGTMIALGFAPSVWVM